MKVNDQIEALLVDAIVRLHDGGYSDAQIKTILALENLKPVPVDSDIPGAWTLGLVKQPLELVGSPVGQSQRSEARSPKPESLKKSDNISVAGGGSRVLPASYSQGASRRRAICC